MDLKLEARRATIDDLSAIINLLVEDELGQLREKASDKLYHFQN